MATVKVSKSLTYTFGEGQADGIDNVSLVLSTTISNPFTGEQSEFTSPKTVQLPSAGWNEEDVLLVLQKDFPNDTVEWE